MKILSSITDTQDAVNKEYIDDLLADYTKTANLGALAFKNSLAFSELASHPTTLSGYGITDGMHWIANMYKADTTYYRHAGYGYPAGGWNGSGPAIAFGISTYYARIQMGNDTETPYLYFNPTVNGTTASKWFRFLFDSGNHNIESDRFSIKGDLVLHRNTDDGDTYLNYGPHANDGASLVIYGQHVSVNATEYILLATPTIYQSIDGAWHNVLNDKNLPNYAYTKTLADETFFPLAGNKTITGYVSIEGEIKGKAISNPTNAAVTNQWRIIRADNALYLQVGTDAGDTAGTFHLTGYSGVAASHIRLHTAKATITGEIDVTGASLLRGAVTANSGMTVQSGITVLNGVSSFVGHTTFSGGITVDGEQAILGPTPSGGTYPRFRVFPHPSGFYFQAATFDGISREGIVRFSGMQGVNAAEVHFRSNSTMFTGSLKVDGQVGTFSQIIGLHSTGAYHRYRINQNSVGTFFQAGVNDGSKQQGTMYLSGIDNTMMTALHLRAEATTVYGSMSIPNAPLTLGSTLSVSGQATLSGGAFLPPSKTIRFQDAAPETFTISFDSEVGGLNLSGATRTLGLASFQKGIQIEYGQSIAFVDKDGNKQCITLDEANGAIKVIGNFFATGQNAAGGAGGEELGMLTSWDNIPTNLEGVTLSASLGIDLYNNSKKVLTSWDDAPTDLTGYTVSAALVQTMNDKITELESMGGGAENILIKVNALSAYDGRTITTNAMQTLTGLSVDVAQKMLQGAYNKVIDNSGDYPEVWDYTARGTSTGIIVYLRIGDGYDTNTAYALTYTQSAANWSIIMGEI